MSCPSPSSLLLLLLIHPDHMECGLFIFVCFGSCAEISTSISLCTVFLFNSCIHRIDIEDYFFKCIRTYSIFTYSQFLMTHLGFFISIHTPTIQPFQKEHQKDRHALLFRFGPGVLWCSWNLSKEQRRKPCPRALPGCRHGVC